jgi:hypothetical protein
MFIFKLVTAKGYTYFKAIKAFRTYTKQKMRIESMNNLWSSSIQRISFSNNNSMRYSPQNQ